MLYTCPSVSKYGQVWPGRMARRNVGGKKKQGYLTSGGLIDNIYVTHNYYCYLLVLLLIIMKEGSL